MTSPIQIRVRAYVGARQSSQAPTYMEGPNRYSVKSAVEGFRDAMRARCGEHYYAVRASLVSGPADKARGYQESMIWLQAAQHEVRDARIESADCDGVEIKLEQPHPPAPLPPFSSNT